MCRRLIIFNKNGKIKAHFDCGEALRDCRKWSVAFIFRDIFKEELLYHRVSTGS